MFQGSSNRNKIHYNMIIISLFLVVHGATLLGIYRTQHANDIFTVGEVQSTPLEIELTIEKLRKVEFLNSKSSFKFCLRCLL